VVRSERTIKKTGLFGVESRYCLSSRDAQEHTVAQWLGLIATANGRQGKPNLRWL
jgi:hypothetical protein